ncbi:hypothetical protein E2C01_017442 [Portunus trituberculatus]|uniref:Uncharacterized protein n=1 Tax=Portunus trituberculatus TaxID=210409 RepID=A0A5B7DSG6_PORTR|nr:hypothetical protein [Portunus trituberculatus]
MSGIQPSVASRELKRLLSPGPEVVHVEKTEGGNRTGAAAANSTAASTSATYAFPFSTTSTVLNCKHKKHIKVVSQMYK